MTFAIYIIGYLILIAGLAYAAFLAHVPQHWIVAGVIVMLGLGVITGAASTRHRDPSV